VSVLNLKARLGKLEMPDWHIKFAESCTGSTGQKITVFDLQFPRRAERPSLRVHRTANRMFSSVLRSPRAVEANIAIMRTFLLMPANNNTHIAEGVGM
jgi:hypothetical protein